MPLETDFNVSPTWNDYDELKNYHGVLFQPTLPVQVRELNQLQTILQNQIERFGENIFKDGTIIKGCPITFDDVYCYVKLRDLQVDGQPLNPSEFVGTILKSSGGLEALVVNSSDGLESQNPDLNTLFVKYQNSGNSGELEFAPSDVLSAYSRDYRLQRIIVANSGIGYNNNDIVLFTSNNGSNAAAVIVTDNSGKIQNAVLTSPGKNFVGTVTAAVANSIGGTANGTGAILTPEVVIAQVTVAPNTFANSSNSQWDPVGVGYSMRVGDGIIFQKGYFVRVDAQDVIVSKYSATPSNVVVGFVTKEIVVNNSVDTSLNDNAQGGSGFGGPGAFRLKLEPVLTVKDSNTVSNTSLFFSVVEYINGRPVKVRQTTDYNIIGQTMARRTSEESGDYVVNPFNVVMDDISANTTHIQAKVGAGVGYISGYRVEQNDSISVPVRKGTDTIEKRNVNISMSLGNYVNVNSFQGTFPFNEAASVDLYSGTSTGISSGSGTLLGTAKIRGVAYDSGTPGDPNAIYRIYLFDVRMNSGQDFSAVKSIFYNGTNKGAANIILDSNSKAVIQEPSFKSYVYANGGRATKTMRTAGGNNETTYIYSTVDQSLSFAANGVLQKNLTGDVFPYSGTLDSIEERDFIFIAQATVDVNAASAGTIAYNNSNGAVVGTSTTFLSTYDVGDAFITGTGEIRKIVAIANNTSLTVNGAFAAANSSTSHKRVFVAGDPISFTKTARTITVSGNQVVANLGEALASTMAVTAIYNVERDSAIQLTKNINKSSVVKIALSSGTVNGPWCLGVPDATKLISVTKTSNNNYTTGAVDVTNHFTLDDGQTDTHYGLSYLRKKPTSTLVISATDYMVATFDTYTYSSTGGGVGFFSVDSYPVDDATTPLPSNKIRTEEISVYKSQTGNAYDLRDCVDFRPVASNTANVTSNLALATVNPSNTVSFANTEHHFPTPHKTFEASLQYYLGRYDKITMNPQGVINVVEGPVTETPYPPADVTGAMTVATLTVPPYPTLSYKSSVAIKRRDYGATATLNMQRRFTMADIGKIEKRVNNLEYYTALSLLEKKTKDLVIPSSNDPSMDSFKNGIFIDPLTDFTLTNAVDGEFTAAIDTVANEITSRFSQSKFDLMVSATSGTQVANDIVTLNSASSAYLVQPYASKTRTCSDQHWSFTGNIDMFPSFFNYYDIRFNPYVDLGLGVAVSSAANNVYYNTQTGQVSLTAFAGSINVYSDQSFINQVKLHIPAPSTSDTSSAFMPRIISYATIGDYLNIDTSGTQYVYEHAVIFKATGLKPNTNMLARFDGVDVSYWTVGMSQATYERNLVNKFNFLRAGFGGPNALKLTSDSTGTVYGAFFIPRGYFYTGARLFEIADNLAAPTTYASIVYHSYNYQSDTQPAILSTRLPTDASKTGVDSKTYSTPNLPSSPFAVVPSNTGYESTGTLTFNGSPSPLIQTFAIGNDDAEGQEGIYISSLDLYFKSKDTRFGVSVEIRTVENDIPTSTVVPMARTHLPSTNVNVSDDASVATTFNFSSPIFLRAGYHYAFAIKADGNSPDYEVWVAKAGDTDKTHPALKCRQDWGDGKLFTSTNDVSVQAVADEDIKFNLYRTGFSGSSGTVTLTNRNDEFFTIANTSGTFMHGEPVFALSNTFKLAGNVSFAANSLTLTGVGTSFLTALAAGATIHVANTATPNSSSDFTTLIVSAIANNTSLTLLDLPSFDANNVAIYMAPTGVSYFYDSDNNALFLTGSSAANSTFRFSLGDTLVGTLTGATATISTIDNLPISYFEPIIYRTSVTGTNISGSVQLSDSLLNLQASQPFKLNNSNYITDFNAVVASRTNEILSGNGKSFRLTLTLESDNHNISPTVDLQSASILRYAYLINNDSTSENTSHGNATSKYVSKTVVLEDGQDAETLRVYINGYKPNGTNIEVYARLQNSLDGDAFHDKAWTKLQQIGTDRSSKITDRNDFYEYLYMLAATPPTTIQGGVASTTNATANLVGSNTSFSTLTDGDVIKVNDSANGRYFVTRVSGSPANNTLLTMATAAPWSSTGATVEKFDDSSAAFINPQNSNVVTYYGPTSAYSGYKYFAVKIVLLSSASNLTPRVKAPRVLALSV